MRQLVRRLEQSRPSNIVCLATYWCYHGHCGPCGCYDYRGHRGVTLCGLHCADCIVRITLCGLHPGQRSSSMRLRCADKRCNVAKEEGLIIRNGNACALLYKREGTLYWKPTFLYVNSRNCSMECPWGIRINCKHVVIPIVRKPVSSTVIAN